MEKIACISVRLFHIPLAEKLADAGHGDHTHFELITVTIALSDGREGTGYSYTGGVGGFAIAAMIERDLAPFLIGKDATDIEALCDAMGRHLHYVGRGGVASFAISAIDIALWDIRAKSAGKPLWQLAGGTGETCKAYCGGIDLGFPLPKLLDNVQNYLDRGVNGIKIKVGRPALDEDVERVAAVRALIGPDIALMLDANYSMSVDEAIIAAGAFKPYDILWFEEPTNPDDYSGHGRIADASGMALAMGENFREINEFRCAFEQSKPSFIQPDASNCGGITGFLRVAKMAGAYGVPVCSHGMQELHVSLLSGISGSGWLEIHAFPIEHYTMQSLVIEDAKAVAPHTSGIGVSFDWAKLEAADLLAQKVRRVA